MKKNKEVELRKLPLHVFIVTLIEVFNSGADFIDIVGEVNNEQDSITVVVREDYYSKEDRVYEEEPIKLLSEDELNQLI